MAEMSARTKSAHTETGWYETRECISRFDRALLDQVRAEVVIRNQ